MNRETESLVSGGRKAVWVPHALLGATAIVALLASSGITVQAFVLVAVILVIALATGAMSVRGQNVAQLDTVAAMRRQMDEELVQERLKYVGGLDGVCVEVLPVWSSVLVRLTVPPLRL